MSLQFRFSKVLMGLGSCGFQFLCWRDLLENEITCKVTSARFYACQLSSQQFSVEAMWSTATLLKVATLVKNDSSNECSAGSLASLLDSALLESAAAALGGSTRLCQASSLT